MADHKMQEMYAVRVKASGNFVHERSLLGKWAFESACPPAEFKFHPDVPSAAGSLHRLTHDRRERHYEPDQLEIVRVLVEVVY